jgi:hypothetical protein
MGNVGGSLILLLIALLLLYLAVTGNLGRLFDAAEVIAGTKKVCQESTTTASIGSGTISLSLPSLPSLGHNAQVPA